MREDRGGWKEELRMWLARPFDDPGQWPVDFRPFDDRDLLTFLPFDDHDLLTFGLLSDDRPLPTWLPTTTEHLELSGCLTSRRDAWI